MCLYGRARVCYTNRRKNWKTLKLNEYSNHDMKETSNPPFILTGHCQAFTGSCGTLISKIHGKNCKLRITFLTSGMYVGG